MSIGAQKTPANEIFHLLFPHTCSTVQRQSFSRVLLSRGKKRKQQKNLLTTKRGFKEGFHQVVIKLIGAAWKALKMPKVVTAGNFDQESCRLLRSYCNPSISQTNSERVRASTKMHGNRETDIEPLSNRSRTIKTSPSLIYRTIWTDCGLAEKTSFHHRQPPNPRDFFSTFSARLPKNFYAPIAYGQLEYTFSQNPSILAYFICPALGGERSRIDSMNFLSCFRALNFIRGIIPVWCKSTGYRTR